MSDESKSAGYGHALTNLFSISKDYRKEFGDQPGKTRDLSSIKNNLRLFGPNFIGVLKDNPKFPSLGITDDELNKLLLEIEAESSQQ